MMIEAGLTSEAELAKARAKAEAEAKAHANDVVVRFNLDTTDDCWGAACWLFFEIEKRHGPAPAKAMYRALGARSAQRRRHINDAKLVALYEMANKHYGWTVQRTAHQAAEINKSSPKDRPFGLSGSTSEDALRQALKRAIKRKKNPKPRR
jgi:hypothetical protein